MTAIELLKEYILEQALNSNEIPEEDKEWVKTFEDLVEWNQENKDKYYDSIIDHIVDSEVEVYHEKIHDEYSSFDNQYVYKIKDKFIQIWIPSDENICNSDFFKEILEGIDKAKFVKPVEKTITVYESI